MRVIKKDKGEDLDYIERMYRGEKYAYLRDKPITDEYQMAEFSMQLHDKRWSAPHSSFVRGMQKWHKAGVDRDELTLRMGPFKNQETATIGVMETGTYMMLMELDPDFLKDKKRLYKFLNTHPEYKVPGSRTTPIPEMTR